MVEHTKINQQRIGVIVMKALITGASSGIGKEMAIYLSEKGIDLVLLIRENDS